MVLVCCDVQDPHATFQCYEEGPMGVNRTVGKCFSKILFSLASGSFKFGWVV